MATALRCLAEAVWLKATAQALYVQATTGVVAITRATFSNTSATPQPLTVWVLAAGEVAPNDRSKILPPRTLIGGEVFDAAELCHQLEPGDAVWAQAAVDDVIAARLSGIVQTT